MSFYDRIGYCNFYCNALTSVSLEVEPAHLNIINGTKTLAEREISDPVKAAKTFLGLRLNCKTITFMRINITIILF